MQKEIEKRINESAEREIRLQGNVSFTLDKSNTFTVGRLCVKGIVTVTRSDIIIDGSNAQIDVHINDCTTSDWSLFFIHPAARNVQFRNMHICVYIQNPTHSTRMFSLIQHVVRIENRQLQHRSRVG